MSCMVMNPEPLAALANAVEVRLNTGYNFWGFEAPEGLARALSDCRVSGFYSEQAIYDRLYALNVRAYCGRYDEPFNPEEDNTAPAIDLSRYRITFPPVYGDCVHGGTTFATQPWHYQLAQLLDFWIYQCSEDATRKDPLLEGMRQFRDRLYEFIVTHSQEYRALRWGRLSTEKPGGGEGDA